MSRAQPLATLFAVSVLSAGAAFLAAPQARRLMEGHVRLRGLAPDTVAAAGYAVAFVLSFLLMSFIARHVKFSLKPQGLQPAKGVAPKIARLMLVAAVFAAPLAALLHARVPQARLSLQALVEESGKKAGLDHQNGYRRQDRAGLEGLILKENAHD